MTNKNKKSKSSGTSFDEESILSRKTEDKLRIYVEVNVSSLDEIKELLPVIAALEKKYCVELKINYLASTLDTVL